MAKVRIDAEPVVNHLADDFTDPWQPAETILLLHGNTENSAMVRVGSASIAPPSSHTSRHARLWGLDTHGARFYIVAGRRRKRLGRRTMATRLGRTFPAQGVEWFVELMAQSPLSSTLGFISSVPLTDNRLHKEMCAEKISFKAAREVLVTDWRVAYREYYGGPR